MKNLWLTEHHSMIYIRNRNRNRKLQTSKAPLKSQVQGTSLFTSAASNQVILLLEEHRKYPNLSELAKAASTAFCRHLWYIQEILVSLLLFDDMVGVDVKSQTVTNLCLPQSTNSVKCSDLLVLPLASQRDSH